MMRPDDLWVCPVCGESGHWDDENYERQIFGEDQ